MYLLNLNEAFERIIAISWSICLGLCVIGTVILVKKKIPPKGKKRVAVIFSSILGIAIGVISSFLIYQIIDYNSKSVTKEEQMIIDENEKRYYLIV